MTTVLHRLEQWSRETPNAIAQRFKEGGTWREITARDYCERVHHLALFLESRGITNREAGAVFSYNCPEWVHLDLATLLLGARSGGLYPNANPAEIDYVIDHTEATVLSVQNREYFQRIGRLPERVKVIVTFDGDTSFSPKAVAYEAALAEGRRLSERPGAKSVRQFLDAIDPRAGAFMIYTSGTTGKPKGALLSHDNMTFTADLASKYWRLPYARGSTFSFLPLCHIAEKMQNVGVAISRRYVVSFATRFENVATELPEVQPTLLLCVPRLWEKMMEGVMKKVRSGTGAKRRLALWALEVGARAAEAKYSGREPSPIDRARLRIADRLVLSKVRQALGLARAEMVASGAASLPATVSRWFRALGIEILEVYGQTESTGVITMTEPGVDGAGTVGRPVPGTEFRLAEDGEILTRGRHVFVGYFKDPAASAAALDDGWLRTGDLAVLDERGRVVIRGRKKEIMKTSGGKMVAPLPIEEKLKASDLISQVCMVGDGRKFVSALITLSETTLAELKERPGGIGEHDMVVDRDILERVAARVEAVNAELAGYERIKRFSVIGREFSIVEGEMTPTLKMKRAVIEERFKPVIDRMYSEAGQAAGE